MTDDYVADATLTVMDHWMATRKITKGPSITIAQWYGWSIPPLINSNEMGVKAKLRAIYTDAHGYVGLYIDTGR
jgi:hypothetical protein